MSWTQAETDIYEQALANVADNNKALARMYLKTQKDIADKLKQFFLSVDPSWSQQYQAQRLSEIFKEINRRLTMLTGISIKQIEDSYLDIYKTTFYSYAYDLSGYYTGMSTTAMTGQFVPLPFSIAPESLIKKGLMKPIGKYNFREYGRYAKKKLLEDLREQVAMALQKGEGPAKLAKRLNDIFGEAITRHTATARTELLKAYSLAQEESVIEARDMGIEFNYQWLGRDDGRERASHVAVNNKFARSFTKKGDPIFKVGESKGTGPRLLVGKDSKAQNIQCRCRRLNVPGKIEDEDLNSFPVINGKPSYRVYIDKYLKEQGY